MLRILIFDESPDRSLYLRLMLERVGYEIVAEIEHPLHLHDEVSRLQPDAIIIETESPSRDTLENLCLISERCPRPIVMFTQDADSKSIRKAVSAGVTAYVVDGLAPERVQAIVETALAQFEIFQQVKSELSAAKTKLTERKLIERAKGILMREKKISEEEAYRMLRTLSMNRNTALAKVCEHVVSVAHLLT